MLRNRTSRAGFAKARVPTDQVPILGSIMGSLGSGALGHIWIHLGGPSQLVDLSSKVRGAHQPPATRCTLTLNHSPSHAPPGTPVGQLAMPYLEILMNALVCSISLFGEMWLLRLAAGQHD